jgi:hypothetical protein
MPGLTISACRCTFVKVAYPRSAMYGVAVGRPRPTGFDLWHEWLISEAPYVGNEA